VATNQKQNVWEFLGLPANHRDSDHIVQYVKTYDDLDPTKVCWPRIAQPKEDGVYSLLVMPQQGVVGIFGRTGNQLSCVDHIMPKLSGNLPVLVIAELCCDRCSLEELSGIVNPNRVNPLNEKQIACLPHMYFVAHDMLFLNEFIDGYSCRGYERRERSMRGYMDYIFMAGRLVQSTVVPSYDAWMVYTEELISFGKEGSVSKDPGGTWTSGKQNEVQVKEVRGVDFDLQVIGIEEGNGKHSGMVGKLLTRWRMYGRPEGAAVALPVDGRFTQDMRKAWFANPELILDKIVHVHALQLGSKGSLRLPKVRVVRIDKTQADL
jgi:hypothetical protein